MRRLLTADRVSEAARHSGQLRHRPLDDEDARDCCRSVTSEVSPSTLLSLLTSTPTPAAANDVTLRQNRRKPLPGCCCCSSDSGHGSSLNVDNDDDTEEDDDVEEDNGSRQLRCQHAGDAGDGNPRASLPTVSRLCRCEVGDARLRDRVPPSCCRVNAPRPPIPHPRPRHALRRRVTPLPWSHVTRAGVALLVMMSCLGVNLAYPASPPGPYPGAGPLPQRLSESEKQYRQLQTKALKYLAQFGYLTGPSRETGNLMSVDDLSKAVKSLQAMGGLPQTGVIDQRTQELMVRPRCGNVDSTYGVITGQGRMDLGQNTRPIGADRRRRRRKRYTEAPSMWKRTNLTFRLINYSADMSRSKTREVIRDAFTLWSDSTQLEFTEATSGEADIMIQFASSYHQDGYPFDGKGMILAHAFFPGTGKGGDTHFDDDETWTINSTDGVDLFMVAAHEFGHALGLAHSADPGALMYPWYQGFSGKFVLPRDDMEGIQKLYGPPVGEREFRPSVSLIPTGEGDDDRQRARYDDTPTQPDDRSDVGDRGIPDPCTTPIDAIAIIRSDIFIFFGQYFLRMEAQKMTKENVTNIHQFWYNLPSSVKKIDAAWERPTDRKIIFFAGDRFWEYSSNHLVSQFPKEGLPITEFGIPADIKHIDAVFTWGFNKRTYFVSGDMYWKLDENNTRVEYDYPRDMSIWRGVPVPLDAAFKYWDEKTYFFKGKSYWKFYDLKMRVEKSYPRSIAEDWLNCGTAQQQIRQEPQKYSASSHHYGAVWLTVTLLAFSLSWTVGACYCIVL